MLLRLSGTAEFSNSAYMADSFSKFLDHAPCFIFLWWLWVFLEFALLLRYPLSALYSSGAVDAPVEVNRIINFSCRGLYNLPNFLFSCAEFSPLFILLLLFLHLVFFHPILKLIRWLVIRAYPRLLKILLPTR